MNNNWTTLPNRTTIKDYEYGVSIADKVKYIRKEADMTQAEFAKMLGCATSEIPYLERGYIPDNKNRLAVINKLFRLWYELKHKEDTEV